MAKKIIGFAATPLVRIDLRFTDVEIHQKLHDFERANGIMTVRGGSGGPYEKLSYYEPEDAEKVVAFLRGLDIPEMSLGRLHWDRLDAVERKEVLKAEGKK